MTVIKLVLLGLLLLLSLHSQLLHFDLLIDIILRASSLGLFRTSSLSCRLLSLHLLSSCILDNFEQFLGIHLTQLVGQLILNLVGLLLWLLLVLRSVVFRDHGDSSSI